MIDLEAEVDIEPLIQALNEISREGRMETVEQMQTAARMIRDEARALCPVDTGSLRKSIRAWKRQAEELLASVGVSAGGYVVNLRTGRIVDYALHVEHGTSMRAPQAFMRPAFEVIRPLILANVNEAWRKVMEATAHG